MRARTFNFLRYLGDRHEVTLVTQQFPDVSNERVQALREWVRDLAAFAQEQPELPRRSAIARAKQLGKYLKGDQPPNLLAHYSPAMQTWIDEAIASGTYDAVTCEHSLDEVYVRPEWRERLRTVVNVHSSLAGTCKQYLDLASSKTLRDQLNLPLLRRYEQRYCSKFSTIVATTVEDKRQLKQLSEGAKIAIVPNGIDLTEYPPRLSAPELPHLLFHAPFETSAAVEAARALCRDIFPEIRRRYPQATLELCGCDPDKRVDDLADSPGVSITSDLRAALTRATVCLQPLPFGLGLKTPVLEAMAVGVPVVGSDVALEGLPADGPDVPLAAMRANTTEEFVYAIGRLLQDAQLRAKLASNARALLEREFSWEQVSARYEQVLMADARSLHR